MLRASVGGGAPQRRNQGGTIFGPSGYDKVPAMLTAGEFVVNAKDAQRNRDLLESINSGASLGFNNGGAVLPLPGPRTMMVAAVNGYRAYHAYKQSKSNKAQGYAKGGRVERRGNSVFFGKAGFGTSYLLNLNDEEKKKIFDRYKISPTDLNQMVELAEGINRQVPKGAKSPDVFTEMANARRTGRIKTPKSKFFTTSLTERRSAVLDRALSRRRSNRPLTPRDRKYIKQNAEKRGFPVHGFAKGGSVGNVGRPLGTSVLDTGVAQQELIHTLNLFNANVSKLAGIAQNINVPSQITMQGTHKVEVSVNGLQVLSSMQESVSALVQSEIRKAMEKHVGGITQEPQLFT
jgi:hypothetical protein